MYNTIHKILYCKKYNMIVIVTFKMVCVQVLETLGRQQMPDGKNLVHPLLVVPSSGESSLQFTDKKHTLTGASVGALCATALGAAAIWKLKAAL